LLKKGALSNSIAESMKQSIISREKGKQSIIPLLSAETYLILLRRRRHVGDKVACFILQEGIGSDRV
jgi:hypothetical protein